MAANHIHDRPRIPPGVSDPQSTSGLCATIVVLDLYLIIIAHGDDGMATHDPFILAGIGDLAGLCSLIDRVINSESEDRRNARSQIRLDAGKKLGGRGSGWVEVHILEGFVVVCKTEEEGRGLFIELRYIIWPVPLWRDAK